ncbi:isopentenyl diphosphate isomerase [Guillardia theta CCMP2712]|uniref:isopentenyl-diphosphate Delta-isomerase n=2 Tax=Guillardia theta TaxID=55529 RepID=L1ICS2_GUITC|nr:isopentenyl diphosphate isomerase [Guillardia theta CCMP2712]ACI45950.1 putative plastid type 1 isopentenyl-diphosphate delta-isomerase 2 precursor [Guillardia theta]EKX34051.1 isopentenyl diphosphate isomerase [Guillardia theta CCMP2712]|mmetsp:Transcript_16960/g.56179  ORF Transcript_16960/g.56179 Transcript_16960/m.56179 type:complete len:316 (-) Transcript_16960:78-1025(-)|eukprot:XP_005821031.1 isopentenyl diphosphate isomerase [Guillardia theta CCMP2712]
MASRAMLTFIAASMAGVRVGAWQMPNLGSMATQQALRCRLEHAGSLRPLINSKMYARVLPQPTPKLLPTIRSSCVVRMMSSSTKMQYDQEQLRLLDSDECIIVNDKDEVLGHGSKKYCHLMENISAGKALHRAFSIFLFNGRGELLLQKRSSDKILFPNRWTNTCCSHPLYNSEEMDDPATADAKGVKQAAVRKLEHELGIRQGQVKKEDLSYLTRIVYKAAVGEDDKWGEHEVDYILVAKADVECVLNPNEVSEIKYLNKAELNALLDAEDKGEIMLSPWFKAIAQRWLPVWWDAVLKDEVEKVKDVETIHILS